MTKVRFRLIIFKRSDMKVTYPQMTVLDAKQLAWIKVNFRCRQTGTVQCVMFQWNQCLLCQCQFQFMFLFLELCNLPRPRTTQLAVAFAPSVQSHPSFTVELCQTHGLNQRPRVEPIGQNRLLRVLACNHSLCVQQVLQHSWH